MPPPEGRPAKSTHAPNKSPGGAPLADHAYLAGPRQVPLVPHGYGRQVSLVHDPVLLRQLARACQPSCALPELGHLLRSLYRALLHYLLVSAWPREQAACPTRMAASQPERGVWHGEVVAEGPGCVVAGMARAGTLPAQACSEALWTLFGQQAARQDHLFVSRVSDAAGQVARAEVLGSKIGGEVAGRWLLLPDPMGATGHSMAAAVATYQALPKGPPARIFALHLIVTPEYLAHMKAVQPEVEVWALRLDRGASAKDILATPLGQAWQQEKGLNEHAYILPGAGGVGELLNHAEH